MKPILRPLLLAASVGATFSLSSSIALGQAAGGYSAGPGLAPPSQREQTVTTESPVPKAAVQAQPAPPPAEEPAPEDQPGYMTRVQTYRPSPSATQVREFSQTRMWVLDPGKYTTEVWWTGEISDHESDSKFQGEIEMGVAPHIQVDIYFNVELDTPEGVTSKLGDHTGVAAEIRVALPDYWGQTFMNPTLYFELQSQYNKSPRAEVRVLLGGELFVPKLLAAANILYEQNIFWGAPNTTDMELGLDIGVNYEVVDGIFRLGAELQSGGDMHGSRELKGVLLAGPSIVLKTTNNRLKLMGTLLFGTQPEDPKIKPVIIASLGF